MIRVSLITLAAVSALFSIEIVRYGMRVNANAVPRYQDADTLSREFLLDITRNWQDSKSEVLVFGIASKDKGLEAAEALTRSLENALAANRALSLHQDPTMNTYASELGLRPVDTVPLSEMNTFAKNMGADYVLTGNIDRSGWVELTLVEVTEGKIIGFSEAILAHPGDDVARSW